MHEFINERKNLGGVMGTNIVEQRLLYLAVSEIDNITLNTLTYESTT